MNTKNWALTALVIVVLFFQGCQTLQDVLGNQKPSAKLTGVGIEDISLDSAILSFDVQLQNPYQVPLPLLNIDYKVTSGGESLFSGMADLQTTIPAEQSKTVSLPIKINYADMVRAFSGIRPGSSIPYNADAGLSVDTPVLGTIRMPLSKAGQLTVPSLSDIDRVDWKKLLEKASQL